MLEFLKKNNCNFTGIPNIMVVMVCYKTAKVTF